MTNFETDINMVFKNVNEWFCANLCSINSSKTHFVHFITKNSSLNKINIEYSNKLISNISALKFLGIIIDNTLSWKNHTDMTVPKLSQACNIVRTKPYLSQDALKTIYYASFHSVMTYGLIFWGNSIHTVCNFKLQKRIIRIIRGTRTRDFSRDLFKILKLLLLSSQYIFF
jgi:hypothetical protein